MVKEHEGHAFLNTKTAEKNHIKPKKVKQKKSLKRENLSRRKQFGKSNEPVLLTESNKQGVLCFLRFKTLKIRFLEPWITTIRLGKVRFFAYLDQPHRSSGIGIGI